jgi:prevent-host-death family protein
VHRSARPGCLTGGGHVAQAWNLPTLVGAATPRFKVVDMLQGRRHKATPAAARSPTNPDGRVTCVQMCYTLAMSSSISVRDLRNTVSEVLRRVEGGERLTVTVDRRPVAEIVPLRRRRTVPLAEAFAIVSRHAADRGLLDDVRGLIADTTDDV